MFKQDLQELELKDLVQDITKVPVLFRYRSPKIVRIKNYRIQNNEQLKILIDINKTVIPQELVNSDINNEEEKREEKFNDNIEKANNPSFEEKNASLDKESQEQTYFNQEVQEAEFKEESSLEELSKESDEHTRIEEINEILDNVFKEDTNEDKTTEDDFSHLTKKEKKALQKQQKQEQKLQRKYEKKKKKNKKKDLEEQNHNSTHSQNKEFINEFLGDVDDEEYEDLTGTGLLQLRASERINKDGYYDISRPYDINLHDKPTINKAAFLVLGLCFVAIIVLTVILFNMLF